MPMTPARPRWIVARNLSIIALPPLPEDGPKAELGGSPRALGASTGSPRRRGGRDGRTFVRLAATAAARMQREQ